MAVVLVGGGSRSGKSRYALRLAESRGSRLGFVATAQALDDEMRERVVAHGRERGDAFLTIEEPFEVAGVLERRAAEFDAIVVDCLTIWLSNLQLDGSRDIETESKKLLSAACNAPACVVLVTNEVGAGIVPDNALARRFRDLAGWLNQQAAEVASEVYWMVFGCPLRVK